MSDNKTKKPFYKRWWVIVIAVFLAIGFIGVLTESDESKAERAAKEVAAEEQRDSADLSQEDVITELIANTIKKEKFKHVVVSEIAVNGDGDLVVLPKLQYNATGGHKSAVRVITKYSDQIAEALSEVLGITELTVFWELPKIHDIGNVAKFGYVRNGDKLVTGDIWLAPAIAE